MMIAAAVIGFGGYPALPALLAAFHENIPTAVHEQNAVLPDGPVVLTSEVDTAGQNGWASCLWPIVGWQ